MIEQDYHNKYILMTGAASGIGFSQLETYLAAGADVYALDSQPIPLVHPRLKTYQIDLRAHDAVTDLVTELTSRVAFDILLNTAGVLR